MTAAPGFDWTDFHVHVSVVLGVAAVGGAYAIAWLRPGGPRLARYPVAFGAGLLILFASLNGPLHELSDNYLFTAHMVQHLLLTLAVAPLLVAGTPGWMADGLLRPLLAWRPTAAVVRRVTRPLPAFAIYGVALVAWHLPAPYNLALEVHGWHIVEHLVLIAASVIGWWPILSASTLAPALPFAAQILYLFVFGMPMTVVAAMVTAAGEPLYPFYAAAPRLFGLTPLVDQRLGGIIMWVPAGIIPVLAFTVVFFRWAAAEAEPSEAASGPPPAPASSDGVVRA